MPPKKVKGHLLYCPDYLWSPTEGPMDLRSPLQRFYNGSVKTVVVLVVLRQAL